jgi:hypothetical protein
MSGVGCIVTAEQLHRAGTWQGRLPQELRLAGVTTVEGANVFLRERYIACRRQRKARHFGGRGGPT